jgi:cytochrome c
VIGNAIRISLPAEFFSAFEYADIWSLLGGRLYEGGALLGADGFPAYLDYASPSDQLRDVLPLPPAACAAKIITWQRSVSICEAKLTPNASGVSIGVADSIGPTTGTADFTCSNGAWSLPNNATCFDPPPPPAPACAPTRFTWTVGGNTCSGLLLNPLVVDYVFAELIRTDIPGYYGYAPVACNASLELILDPRYLPSVGCFLTPPPKPRTTDPLQLATEKNCMACHKLTGLSLGVSFQSIANFYRNSPPAPGVLENKIYFGGNGTFGNVPMPANSQVDSQDLAILVPWILSQ